MRWRSTEKPARRRMIFTEDHSDSMALLASCRLSQAVSAAPTVDARILSISTVPLFFMLL